MLGRNKKDYTTQELKKAQENIRQKYDHFIIHFMKPPEIKQDFEERYLHALRNRFNMKRFLDAESDALQEMIEQEEKRIQNEWNMEPFQPLSPKEIEKKKDFADKIIEQNLERIKVYPGIELSKEASIELSHLFGALITFEKEYWPVIQNLLRKYFKHVYSGMRMNLESDIVNLCCPNLNGYPPRLTGYIHLFDRFPRDYGRIDKEEKLCLTESAVLLNTIGDEITRIKQSDELTDEEQKNLAAADTYVNNLLDDFRLRDLVKLTKGVDYGY